MERYFEQGFFIIAGVLDSFRAWILQKTLNIALLRSIFRHRASRLGTLFILSAILSLALALRFPLWVLAFGPIVYGVPHIAASIRYFHHTLDQGKNQHEVRKFSFGLLIALLTLVFIYRLTLTANFFQIDLTALSEWRGSTHLELGALTLVFLASAWFYRKTLPSIMAGILMLVPLFCAFVTTPYASIGALVLIHNFVAFFFWILSAKSSSERKVAISATLVTLGITIFIFSGALDPTIEYFQPTESLLFANISFSEIGRLLFPWSQNPKTWLHGVIAYALGQNLHYYVWLKAIPDQFHKNETPTSFRQSLRFLIVEFGRLPALGLILLSIGFVFSVLFMTFPQVRSVYFSLAGLHGYIEIAGLALALGGLKSTNLT